jgi:microcystin-dependent protein
MLGLFSVGEISLFPYDFAPVGFMKCEGQLLEAARYPQIFSLIKNRFGGDGKTTFALPDYRNSVPEVKDEDWKMVRKGLSYNIAVDESAAEAAGIRGDEGSQEMSRYMGGIVNFSFDLKDLGNDWVPCDGRELKIAQRQAIFSLLGTRFGGDGMTTFAVPNLVGKAPDKSNYMMSLRGIFPTRDGRHVEALTTEIRLFPYDYVPGGWHACDGQKMAISLSRT